MQVKKGKESTGSPEETTKKKNTIGADVTK